MRYITLILVLLLGCSAGVKDRPLTRDVMQDEAVRAEIEAQLTEDEQTWLAHYLDRADRADIDEDFFGEVTLGEAILRQRQHELELQMQALEDPQQLEREALLDSLRAIVDVEVRGKAFVDDTNRLTIAITNHASTAVSTVQGTLRAVTDVGYRFPTIEIVLDQSLAPGAEYVHEQALNLDLAEKITLQNTAFERITFHWIPQHITLADGSILEGPLLP